MNTEAQTIGIKITPRIIFSLNAAFSYLHTWQCKISPNHSDLLCKKVRLIFKSKKRNLNRRTSKTFKTSTFPKSAFLVRHNSIRHPLTLTQAKHSPSLSNTICAKLILIDERNIKYLEPYSRTNEIRCACSYVKTCLRTTNHSHLIWHHESKSHKLFLNKFKL